MGSGLVFVAIKNHQSVVQMGEISTKTSHFLFTSRARNRIVTQSCSVTQSQGGDPINPTLKLCPQVSPLSPRVGTPSFGNFSHFNFRSNSFPAVVKIIDSCSPNSLLHSLNLLFLKTTLPLVPLHTDRSGDQVARRHSFSYN